MIKFYLNYKLLVEVCTSFVGLLIQFRNRLSLVFSLFGQVFLLKCPLFKLNYLPLLDKILKAKIIFFSIIFQRQMLKH